MLRRPEAPQWSPLKVSPPSPSKLQDLDTPDFEFSALPPRLDPGARIDEYTVIELLGHGGVASIFRARQESRDRDVALKVLSPHLVDHDASIDRFQRESRIAAVCAHPDVIPIFASGFDRYHYYAMKWMECPTLFEAIDGFLGARDERFYHDAAIFFAHLARTVHGLHERGVIHRDIKPSNLFVESDGRLVIGDFGVAVQIDGDGEIIDGDEKPDGDDGRRGVWGTPAYMSPERFTKDGAAARPRIDVYAIGMTLLEYITGKQPYAGMSDEEIGRHKLTRTPPSARQLVATVPLGLDAIVRQSLEKHTALRYQSAEELARDLERFATSRRANTRAHPSDGPTEPFGGSGDDEDDDEDDDTEPEQEPALIV